MTDRLLMLLPYWPPMGGPGVQRGVKFAKYLPSHGVSPYVITRAGAADEDRSLLADSRGVPVRDARHVPFQLLGSPGAATAGGSKRAGKFAALKRVRDWLNLPDHVISWVPFAVNEGVNWASEVHPTAIFTTSPYHSTHLAGIALKQRLNLPWIADFRDPWVGDQFTQYPTALHRRANAAMERSVVKHADAVVVISEGMRRDFEARYPAHAGKFHVIYNGFDPTDFNAGRTPAPQAPWIIRHLGTFYPDRRPDALLRGLARLRTESPAVANAVRVELIGKHHADVEARLKELVSELGLDDLVSFHGYVSHDEALTLLQTSHALLLIPGPGATTVTGKLFEYLAARRPIFTVAPRPSGVDEIFDRLGGNPLRVEEDENAIAQALRRLVNTLEAGEMDSLLPPPERIEQFTRPGAAGQLAALLRKIAPQVVTP